MFRVEYASKVDENFDCVEVRREINFNFVFQFSIKKVLKCKGFREERIYCSFKTTYLVFSYGDDCLSY